MSNWHQTAIETLATIRNPLRAVLQLGTPPADIDGETAGNFWRELMGDAEDMTDAAKALSAASSDPNAIHPIGRWFTSVEDAFAAHTDPAWWQAARLVPTVPSLVATEPGTTDRGPHTATTRREERQPVA